MGIKKSGKRLLKLGRKAARELGKGGKAWVEKVFQTACGVIEEELGRKEKETARERGASTPRSSRTKSAGRAARERKATSASAAKSRSRRGATRRPSKSERSATAKQRPARRRARVGGAPFNSEPRVPESEAAPSPTPLEPVNAQEAPEPA